MSVGSLYGEPHRKDPQVVREREEALTAPRALLLRRAELIRVRAEHAAVTLPPPEHGPAARTCVEVLTGVLGHRLAPRRSAFRTRDRRLCDDPWDRSAAPLGAAGRSAAVRRPLRRRPAAAVRLPRSRSGERECRKPRGIRSLNDRSLIPKAGEGKKAGPAWCLSPGELVRAALRRAWPGSPSKCPISRVPAAVPRTVYSTITTSESYAEIGRLAATHLRVRAAVESA